MTSAEEYGENVLIKERGLSKDSDEFNKSLNEFNDHMLKYTNEVIPLNMPDWPVFCFYSMAKRRGEANNWYALEHSDRKKLMAEHGKVEGDGLAKLDSL